MAADTGEPPSDEEETAGASQCSSGEALLRELAFAPPVEPIAVERDRSGETLGHFRLMEPIGRGGMGVVYAAFDLSLRRKVALKLLRPKVIEDPGRRQRLLKEARAAAAVSHPNIVTVFEVAEVAGEVLIAMELVEGLDARAWLSARPRSWREIVDVLVMAGRGLAAAHRMGLVHLDFKPENVLIDATGRARVADFGLAAGIERPSTPDTPTQRAETIESGGVKGTSGYIAPEHLAGHDPDARADQFAFCVTLFEALEGRRPYNALVLLALSQGAVASPPLRKTPLWLRGTVARGLAAEPGLRFSDMEALLLRLERAKVWPRRTVAVAWAGAAAIAVAAGAPRWQAPGCEERSMEVPAAWISARGAVRDAFARASVPYAADASEHVRLKLDEWADRWSQAQRSTCRRPGSATAVECLARQQADFKAVLALLQGADAQVVARSPAVVDGLEDPRRCLAGARAQSPAGAEAHAEAMGLRQRIAQARALLSAGKYAEGAALAEQLRRDARGSPAVEADAFAVAAMLTWKARAPGAVGALLQARWAAERARRDALSTELALALCEAYFQQGDRDKAEEWIEHAEATRARIGEEPRLESMVLASRASLVVLRDDDRVAARAYALRALALRERALGPDHLEVADSLLLVAAFVPYDYDQLAEGAAQARRALDIRTAALGSDHPDVATALVRLGQIYRDQYDFVRELEVQERALRIRIAALGTDHPEVARAHWGVGGALAALGREVDALQHFRIAQQSLARAEGAGSQQAAVVQLIVADLEAQLGDVEAALVRSRAAIGQLDALLGADSPATVLELSSLADLLVRHGDLAEAERFYDRAIRNGRRRENSRTKVGLPLVGQTQIYLARGQPDRAAGAALASLEVGAELYPRDYPVILSCYRALFDAELARGDLEQAKQQVEAYQAIAERWLAADDMLRVDGMQMRALLSAATGDRAAAVALARAALAAQQARPWQVLRLAEAQGVLARVLGAKDAEAAVLTRDAVRALRAAKAFGSANALLARASATVRGP